ncbi:hypothetical protein [Shouchella lonarensis]|uniref:Uncharacterized protein n=1 Tax=Shouchella lonarensis TaxID=1464122 RepID=A0A1G6HLL5_9BACI|nr:hypothetical protein [Shouchella lonarensis]SDB95197.1 hypothetical protein SAMN05421737_10467 [Shouchella lonarensis]
MVNTVIAVVAMMTAILAVLNGILLNKLERKKWSVIWFAVGVWWIFMAVVHAFEVEPWV